LEGEQSVDESMDSIEASGISSYATEFIVDGGNILPDVAKTVVLETMGLIKSRVLEHSPEFVGHIKMFLENGSETVKMNITAYYEEPIMELISSKTEVPRFKILSAVSNIDKIALIDIVDSSVIEAFALKGIDVRKKSDKHQHHISLSL